MLNLELRDFRSMQLKAFLDLLGVVLVAQSTSMLHFGILRLVNEGFLSPKGINNAAQDCGAAATLG